MFSPSAKPVNPSINSPDTEITLSVFKSLDSIISEVPSESKSLDPTFANNWMVPFFSVVSFATGTRISIPVLVRFHIPSTSFPPVESKAPTVKSIGGVRSNITLVLLVVTLTGAPSFAARSENRISKVISPSGSESVIV